MTADSYGKDITQVTVPVTGNIALAPAGTTLPTPAALAAPAFALPAAFTGLGLRTKDGAPEWTEEKDGDDIEFFEDGYNIPSGLANVAVEVTLAEGSNAFVRKVVTGKVPDANGFYTVDPSTNNLRWVLYAEEIYKNKQIRRRIVGLVSVDKVKLAKGARGENNGYTVTFKAYRQAGVLNGEFYGEITVDGSTVSTAVPTVTSVAPASQVTGGEVDILGTGLASVTAVKFGALTATAFQAMSDTWLKAILPSGTAGSAAVVVTNANGSSTAFAYTRGA